MRGLKGKRVLVTGGASGIGAATAARFLEEGALVCVLDRSAEARERIGQELPDLSGILDADVADRDAVETAFAEAVEQMGAVDVLIKSMALELAPTVRVNAISPGYCMTPMQRAEYTDEMLQQVNNKIPLGRHAKPEEIAALFAFLASEDAAFASGHVYVMDGAETTGGLASQR